MVYKYNYNNQGHFESTVYVQLIINIGLNFQFKFANDYYIRLKIIKFEDLVFEFEVNKIVFEDNEIIDFEE